MSVSPDFEGFAEAQVTLREKFGRDIHFYTPIETTYASGVTLDPASGEPYDPTAVPTASGFVTADVTCSVVNRPMGLSRNGISDTVSRRAIGWLEAGGIVLIVRTETDYLTIEDATEFDYGDERYAVRQTDHDFMGPVGRYLIYGAQR